MVQDYEYKIRCKCCNDVVVVTHNNSAEMPNCNCGKITVDATPFYCRVITSGNVKYETLTK